MPRLDEAKTDINGVLRSDICAVGAYANKEGQGQQGTTTAIEALQVCSLKAYPNPVRPYVHFNQSGELSVYSLKGMRVLYRKHYIAKEVLDLSSLRKGYYIAKIGSSVVSFIKD